MKIYSLPLDEAIQRIRNRDLKICVVGVGTIGLPLATFLANAGFKVVGNDTDKTRVAQINAGKVTFEYSQLLAKVVGEKRLYATLDPKEAISDADVVFICVPTPLTKERTMDISQILDASSRITSHMPRGAAVILESSVAIGTTRRIGKVMEERSGMKMGTDFGLAHCPERYNPTLLMESHPRVVYKNSKGNDASYTLNKISRVVGGVDEKSLKIAKEIYSQIIDADVKELSSIEAAEATKLVENIFRDVNIALVNELAKLSPKLGVDIYEVIEAAKTKPFAFLPHYPGAGVGGECIPVDTWFLIKQAESLGFDTKLLRVAREVNDSMPYHLAEILEEELKKSGRELAASKISVLGLSYKKNVIDARLSPAITLLEILKSRNANFVISDPIMEVGSSPYKLTPLPEAFKDSDAIVLVTDHDVFSGIDFAKVRHEMRTPIVIDGRNFFDKKKIVSYGFSYRSIGRPEK